MRLSNVIVVAVVVLSAVIAPPVLADDKGGKSEKKDGRESFLTSDKTNIDFSDTLIEGKMQAPSGFFLQGRQSQSLSQMVKLRSTFRGELRNSKAAVKALVK